MPRVLRKPVLQAQALDVEPPVSEPTLDGPAISKDPGAANEPAAAEGLIEEFEACPDLDEQLEKLETIPEQLPLPYSDDAPTGDPSVTAEHTHADYKPSKFKAALGEVKHFAGGLIAHPYEATKHYSVMRHSHGLVYYQGPTTSIAITIFSDQLLSSDRKLWLQKRGYSGKTGLKLGATLGTRSAWLDVTPAIDVPVDLLPHGDRRAWQRDIDRFTKKSKDAKHIRNQRPYETNVIRVPHVAEDGYFRVVLCAGRKVLCPSPMFRYVTASLDPGRLRGASLSTLPLELGIKIGAHIAKHAANTAAHGALQPATAVYQNGVQPIIEKYNPMGLTQAALQTAYDESGAAEKVATTITDVGERYGQRRDIEGQLAVGHAVTRVTVIGRAEGPTSPFPLRFSGTVVKGSGKSRQCLGIPTADVSNVSDEALLRLSGVYIAWTTISKTKISKSKLMPEEAYGRWYQALVTVAPIRDRTAKVVEQKHVSVHLMQDFKDATFYDTRLNVLLVAFLHSATPRTTQPSTNLEIEQAQLAADIATTQASLDRPAWTPDVILEHARSHSSNRSLTDKMVDVRVLGQKQIDKVPLHRLGVKTDSMGLKDQLIGTGGICVKR